MIEIVFSDSACGSLVVAQNYGKGKYHGGAVSVFLHHADETEPTVEEIHEAQLRAEENDRLAWENAIPLGGKRDDVYCFDIGLSIGDISDNGIGEQRRDILKKMLSVCCVDDLDYQIEEK